MHWLPLVAMVIASALPFPHSPVPRLVSAATEPGGDLDNNRNGISDRENSSGNVIVDGSYSRSTTSTSLRTDNMDESEGLMDYSSQSNTVHNSLQEDYSSQSNTVHNSLQEDYSSQSNTVHNSLQENYSQIGEVKEKTHVDYRTPSAINHVEHQSQDIQKHTTHSVKSDPCNNTQNISTEDRHPTQGQLGLPHLEDYSPQGNDRQVNDISLDYHTPEDYKSQELVSGENNNFVDNRYPFNTGKGKKDQLTDISVRQNYIPYWDGTENKELSPVHRAPDEPYDYPEKQMEAETEGKEAAIEGGWAGLEAGGEGGWAGLEADGGKLLKDTELLFLDAHPRVLFTPSSSPPKHPPLLLMLEAGLMAAVGERDGRQEEQGEDEEDEGGGALMGRGDPKPRPRRASPAYDRRGERSVCEVANEWVTDKKTAIDIRGNTVTVLPEIQTPRGPLKQYFFETKCRPPDARGTGGSGLSGRDCVGVDKKHWVSECKAKQSYVRALTTHPQKGVGWRWIRIDSSCVCVLQARVPRS